MAELISIIMPCFNAAEYVSRSVLSALEQTYSDIELIVVNDGSTDHSLDRLKAIDDPRLVVIDQPNRGVCAARNRGLSQAKGRFIAFLDADDTWRRDCLEKLHAALVNAEDAALAYCGWQNVGLPGRQGEPYIPRDYEASSKLEYLLRSCPWPIHAALIRQSVIQAVGGFDTRFPTSEDYGLWLKLSARNRIILVPEVMAFYHHHTGSRASKDSVQVARNHWLVQREFIKDNPSLVSGIKRSRLDELTHGELLKRGYQAYWKRDLDTARAIFYMVMKVGYGKPSDWKYMIPSLLPLAMHRMLVRYTDRT